MGIRVLYFLFSSIKGPPPPQKSQFFEKNGNWVFNIGRCAEDSSFRIYMGFWKTIRFWPTYEGNMRAVTMFFEKFLRFFEIFQFLKDWLLICISNGQSIRILIIQKIVTLNIRVTLSYFILNTRYLIHVLRAYQK